MFLKLPQLIYLQPRMLRQQKVEDSQLNGLEVTCKVPWVGNMEVMLTEQMTKYFCKQPFTRPLFF